MLKTSNIGISLSRLVELLIALIVIYKVSSLLVLFSSKKKSCMHSIIVYNIILVF